jgi:thiol-disulfide isomerase/thioredoxin
MALVVGLYFVNRFWIAPATARQAQAAKVTGDHPAAPHFSLTDITGQKLSLADYKGKVVMLDFWATWCGPCRIEIPGFVELQNRYRDQGFAVIGISKDDGPEVVREFYKQYRMNYPVALGDDKLDALYGGIFGMPTTFLIGRDGRIYAKHVGAMDVSVFEDEIKTLLAAPAGEEATFKPAGRTDEVDLGDSPTANSEVPGVDISSLNAAELTGFKKQLEGQSCTCGCKLNLLRCRREDRACGVSRKLAREQLAKLSKSRV